MADYHQKVAESYCAKKVAGLHDAQNKEIGLLKQSKRESEIPAVLEKYRKLKEEYSVPKHLTYLEGTEAQEYLEDMYAAQKFAEVNRSFMAEAIAGHLGLNYKHLTSFITVHNYIDPEDKVIRKGAIRALQDEVVIIPINMKVGSILAKGKGNVDWNNSAPHGAGRLMSRSEAKAKLDLGSFEQIMEGVWTTSVGDDTLDEAPDAYKPVEEILANIDGTVDVLAVLKPRYNFKSSKKHNQIKG
ncbi:RNA-splicing ligase RtcB [compost metagenome]